MTSKEFKLLELYTDRIACGGLDVEVIATGRGFYDVRCGAVTLVHLEFRQAWDVLTGVSLGWQAARVDPVDSWLPTRCRSSPYTLSIESLDLMSRSYNCLKRKGIHTVLDLISYSEVDLLDIRNLGIKSIDEIKLKLVDLGLSLKDSRPGFNFDGGS